MKAEIISEHSRKLIVLSLRWYDIRIHQGILEYAKDHNWDVVASPHMSNPLDIPEADGQIVMLGSRDHRRMKLVEASRAPAIDLGHYNTLGIPRVYPDNVMAGEIAALEFIERGFVNFAVFSTQSHWYVDDRKKGFRRTIENKGFSCQDWHLPQTDPHKGSFSPDGHDRKVIEKWLTHVDKPLAIFSIEDEGAAMLLRACRQLGIAVPEQVALIGANNDPVICPYTEVSLSSVDLNWEGVGYEAAARLDQLMQGKKLKKSVILVPPKGLVSRKSSDTIAVNDLRVALALSYIQENSDRPITVTEITENVGIPLRTLQWAIQKSLGRSLQDEISRIRVERIEDLLKNTDRKIGQIAEDLNFSSAQYMNHFFAKATGVTPNEYRKQVQNNR
ncbi:MAG: DNA-binding transcriptional regulator [Kiritimatiellales bacterium]